MAVVEQVIAAVDELSVFETDIRLTERPAVAIPTDYVFRQRRSWTSHWLTISVPLYVLEKIAHPLTSFRTAT